MTRERARGAPSGADVTSRNYAVLMIRSGKILRYREFYDGPHGKPLG